VVGNIICVGALWTRYADLIRFGQLIAVSPCWLAYNVFMFSIAGILLESFNIISIIVYYIRRRINKKRAQEPQGEIRE
ncbi:MAG: YgjV family protein, partial [Clostridia bacterium]|nr:YgjV family protein [Clostridia bacterium]